MIDPRSHSQWQSWNLKLGWGILGFLCEGAPRSGSTSKVMWPRLFPLSMSPPLDTTCPLAGLGSPLSHDGSTLISLST